MQEYLSQHDSEKDWTISQPWDEWQCTIKHKATTIVLREMFPASLFDYAQKELLLRRAQRAGSSETSSSSGSQASSSSQLPPPPPQWQQRLPTLVRGPLVAYLVKKEPLDIVTIDDDDHDALTEELFNMLTTEAPSTQASQDDEDLHQQEEPTMEKHIMANMKDQTEQFPAHVAVGNKEPDASTQQKPSNAVEQFLSKAKGLMANEEEQKHCFATDPNQELDSMQPHLKNKDLAMKLAMDFLQSNGISLAQPEVKKRRVIDDLEC